LKFGIISDFILSIDCKVSAETSKIGAVKSHSITIQN
jgi:hypothetical protein